MTEIKCPNCGNLNSTAENYCLNCGTSILNLRPPVYAPPIQAAPPQFNQPFQSYGFNVPQNFNAAQFENPLGGKVFVWYRVFCGLIALVSLVWVLMGVIAIANNGSRPTPKDQNDAILGGIMFLVYGLFYFIPYLLALFIPPKPKHWVFGIILIALALLSCFFPFAVPLLIYWVKPETKAYFGRS